MSDALVIPFRSQLSCIMESILKSAVTEITRLVEESFVEEVARGKRELELLLHRLQFSESKLKERERRGRCTDCVRAAAGGERVAQRTGETLTGEDALCFRLSLREQSEKRAPFTDVWRSTQATHQDLHVTMETCNENNKNNNNPPHGATLAVTEPRETLPGSEDVRLAERPSSPGRGTPKVEPEHDPVAVKEEQETLPVWDDPRGDEGPWTPDDTQVDHFPNLSDLAMPGLSSCSAKPEPGQWDPGRPSPVYDEPFPPPELLLRSENSLQREAGARRPRCSQCAETFAHELELTEHHRRRHAQDRPHVCPACGKAFTRFSNFKQHLNIHTHEKLFNCTQCSMSFKRSTHLRVHLRRHARAGRGSPCRHCGKSFMCLKQLKDHVIRVHGTEQD